VTLALVLVPLCAGLIAFVLRGDRPRRVLLVATALAHAALVGRAVVRQPEPALGGWLGVDAPALVFLVLVSALFLAASSYAVGYLAREQAGPRPDFEERTLFYNGPEAVFVGCLLLFLASMTLVTVSRHLGLLWVAIEATTLASTPLIYFHRHHRSLEAAWKYLLICSVGIGLALLGNLFLAVADPATHGTLVLDELIGRAPGLDRDWLRAAFLFLLVGYGTKMGLAPLHSWLPDAHSESPSLVSALLSGALLNCAFLGLLRARQVLAPAGLGGFADELFVVFGLVSMLVAAIFVVRQADYKRLLAYSSVEHMGILSLGVGLGAGGTYGALLHAVSHSFTKAMLFLVSGNLIAVYASKRVNDVRGAISLVPASGVLWLLGFFAIAGSPPFGPFLSELQILHSALAAGRSVVAAAYLALLGVIFVAMAATVLPMVQGAAPTGHVRKREPWSAVAPAVALGVFVLLLGLWIPAQLSLRLELAASVVRGAP
jgi:hydrogenase-4 component F